MLAFTDSVCSLHSLVSMSSARYADFGDQMTHCRHNTNMNDGFAPHVRSARYPGNWGVQVAAPKGMEAFTGDPP